ncbi:peptide ABC transporter ATP-binding protein [Aureimonas ureilytica]|uniref:Peptide ABC transporter ATP-binding protein n=1 Tax=Aureimonas ureilytica TaxID=401562 RepID=A0A175RYF2_9HYPH|nr:DMT family transporter [Aureimonas ureilytica]KTR07984.1 peptide ABC transporter ATP-binding protein [Aureimonas ureilytica]
MSGLTQRLLPAFPVLFVLLWSTGFVGARYAMPHAEPFTFLALRFALAILLLLPVALYLLRRRGVPLRPLGHAAFAGSLIHGVYLGGVFFAVRHGLPAGITALVAGLQPFFTALIARASLGERLTRRHQTGLAIGLVGVFLVVAPKLGTGAAFGPATLVPALIGVVAIALGTVWQKRFVTGLDLRVGACAQYVGALVPVALAAFLFETMRVDWTLELVLSLAWLTLALSIGAVMLLLVLIRNGSVSSVASLFYLVPSVTALMAFVLFGERLTAVQLLGMLVAAAGVWLATRTSARRRE